MTATKPEDSGTISLSPGRPPSVQLGPFETKLGTIYTIEMKILRKGNWIKSLRLKASTLPTDPETLNILINEDMVIAL